jgi:hypothetical protein
LEVSRRRKWWIGTHVQDPGFFCWIWRWSSRSIFQVTVNTGGGGGAVDQLQESGGSGIVVVRTPSATAGFISATPGTNTVTSAPCGVHK